VLAVDSVIICAGQESLDELSAALTALGVPAHAIGGARQAAELDAFAAIAAGSEVAATL